jgi:hypothetical protein
MRTEFFLESLKRRDYSEDTHRDGITILKLISGKMRWKVVYWIHLTQDRDSWQALVNTVMNLRVPLKAGSFLTS